MTGDVVLTVNGKRYSGWKSVRVERSIEQLAGAFALTVSDRWPGQGTPWPLREGDDCTLTINGETVITGFLDRRRIHLDGESRTLEVSGRDAAADLVDSSVRLTGAGATPVWEFQGQRLDQIVMRICADFSIPLTLGKGVGGLTLQDRFSINPGETAFEVIDRCCKLAGGPLFISDSAGGVRIELPGAQKATSAIVEGGNLLSIDASYDVTGVFHTYWASGQTPGTDTLMGDAAASITGTAIDASQRTRRKLWIHTEGNTTLAQAKARAEWEAAVRAARAGRITATVVDWVQENGKLWPLNGLVRLKSPEVGIDGQMLIAGIVLTQDDTTGTLTTFDLARPDAFRPMPVIAKGSEPWGPMIAGAMRGK